MLVTDLHGQTRSSMPGLVKRGSQQLCKARRLLNTLTLDQIQASAASAAAGAQNSLLAQAQAGESC